jgi:DNA-binding NtrC family response regulator
MSADNRVLILDMRSARRDRLAESLGRLGYRSTFAESIASAQALWEREAFPIVIADARDRRAQVADLRVFLPGSGIIVVGARSLAAALAAWHAGADDYLPWPVREEELASALEHMLRTRAAKAAELAEARPEPSALPEFRRMAAELAQQINTPLTPLLGMIDLLAEELPPTHPGHEYAQAIAAAALRIRDVAWMLADIAGQSE